MVKYVDFIMGLAENHGSELIIVGIGPLTPLADALKYENGLNNERFLTKIGGLYL